VFVYPQGDAHEPASFTVLNLVVPDLAATAAELATLERYPGMPQDDDGIVRSTDPSHGPTIA
jgi:hypothetical protein